MSLDDNNDNSNLTLGSKPKMEEYSKRWKNISYSYGSGLAMVGDRVGDRVEHGSGVAVWIGIE